MFNLWELLVPVPVHKPTPSLWARCQWIWKINLKFGARTEGQTVVSGLLKCRRQRNVANRFHHHFASGGGCWILDLTRVLCPRTRPNSIVTFRLNFLQKNKHLWLFLGGSVSISSGRPSAPLDFQLAAEITFLSFSPTPRTTKICVVLFRFVVSQC